jgi:hypothetical protein
MAITPPAGTQRLPAVGRSVRRRHRLCPGHGRELEDVEGARFRVWLIASAVALLAVVTVLASLSGMYAHSGRGKGLLLLQVVVVLTLAALVIWFALAIPVPAGTHSAPLFGGD